MKIKLRAVLILNLFIGLHGDAQNLVSNPGFEILSSCPNTTSQIANATGWNTSSNSPDLFNSCNGNGTIVGMPGNICGYQQSFGGNGYMGLLCYGSFSSSYSVNIREYATGMLTSPLVIGQTYSASFHVVLMNQSSHEVDHIDAKFVMSYNPSLPITNSAQVFSTLPISDTLNWTTISGTFVADSAYNFIVIGNHFDDANTIANSIQPVTFGWNAYYFVDDIEVTALNQQPVSLFSATNHICPGACIDFTNLSSNGISYQWTFSGANPSTSTDVSPATICYNVPGTYPVQLIASNATGSDTLILSNYITVYPYPSPQGIVQSGDTLFANAGATSYQWYFNGNVVNGATDYFCLAPQSGDYNVVATDANGCEVEAAIFSVLASAQTAVGNLQLAIFPNQVGDQFTIHNAQLAIGTAVEISIYNMFGEKINSAVYSEPATVNCEPFPGGMYYLVLTAGLETFRTKFVKK
jgi:PKD repeat protein